MDTDTETSIKTAKQHRKDLDDVLQRIKASGPSREFPLPLQRSKRPSCGWAWN